MDEIFDESDNNSNETNDSSNVTEQTTSTVTANKHQQQNGKNHRPSVPFVEVHKGTPIRLQVKVTVPTEDHPNYNFVGKLLGPKGNSLKWLQEQTQTKMAILGRGSMRNKQKEEELRRTNNPRFSHLNENLHVEITAIAPAPEAYLRMSNALGEIKRFLVPDYFDEIRQQQLRELGVIPNDQTLETTAAVVVAAATTPATISTKLSTSNLVHGNFLPISKLQPPPPSLSSSLYESSHHPHHHHHHEMFVEKLSSNNNVPLLRRNNNDNEEIGLIPSCQLNRYDDNRNNFLITGNTISGPEIITTTTANNNNNNANTNNNACVAIYSHEMPRGNSPGRLKPILNNHHRSNLVVQRPKPYFRPSSTSSSSLLY